MTSSKLDFSPVGWYVATYQLRFVELADRQRNSPARRFLCCENTILVKARSMREAHRKVIKVGESHTNPYKGGPDGVEVQWVFEGIIDLLPVYEEIEDGAEIMWGRADQIPPKHAKACQAFRFEPNRPFNRITRENPRT